MIRLPVPNKQPCVYWFAQIVLITEAPSIILMVVLILLSAFFSASEAALFYLQPQDLRVLARGRRSQQLAVKLLDLPDRLLSAVLFWNLTINMVYFAVSASVGLRMQKEGGSSTTAIVFNIVSILAIIFFSEMMPKSFAVMRSRSFASVIGLPLSIAVSIVDPLMPLIRGIQTLTGRLFYPRFRKEQRLEMQDIRRAMQITAEDAGLTSDEHTILKNIIGLSEFRADEWMRPRSRFITFSRPTRWEDLKESLPPSGYILITERDNEEIESAIALTDLDDLNVSRLDKLAEPVTHVPWSASVADTFQHMHEERSQVASVVNEFGDTIGIITMEDILDSVLTMDPSRTQRLADVVAIEAVGVDQWRVFGITSLKRLGQHLEVELPESQNKTLNGVLQEVLQRLPQAGDQCIWGSFELTVHETRPNGQSVITVKKASSTEETS